METVAKEYGHEILRLPAYHCELNPIELAWAAEKNYVAGENKDMSLDSVVLVTVKSVKTMWRNIQIVRRVKARVKWITLMTNLNRTSQGVAYKIDSTEDERTCFSFFKNHFSVREVEDLN